MGERWGPTPCTGGEADSPGNVPLHIILQYMVVPGQTVQT